MYRVILCGLILCLMIVGNESQTLNLRPIIGILTQPGNKTLGSSYIAASYVKFIESAGARVVPIFHTSTKAELFSLFNSINGILFPGGDANLDHTELYDAAAYLYDLALDAFNRGDYFPIEGHCMGFELLNMITSRNFSILESYKAVGISYPLDFAPGFKNSGIFANAPEDIINTFSKQAVTLNNHVFGVNPLSYQNNQYLKDFYQIVSTNLDENNKEFVSTIQGKVYPIYGLQWHAEKPLFEWNTEEVINHSTDSIKAMQYIADHFVTEARKNLHKFPNVQTETASLIYNYNPLFTGKWGDDFEQCYYFK